MGEILKYLYTPTQQRCAGKVAGQIC